MTTDWNELKQAFAELAELAPDERERRLRLLPTDLATTLRPLLAADDAAASILDPLDPASAAPAPDPLGLIGATVGRFRVLQVLGTGGMGVTYAAEDMRLGRAVALKFLHPHVAHDEDARRRFLHEARVASALDHPNVCTLLEIGDSAHGPFIAMPAYPGATLRSRIESAGPLPIDDAVAIARQLLLGLAATHAAGIMHRDLKPANVQLTPEGRAIILDFGLARTGDMLLSTPALRAGTVAYMSPEQLADGEADARSDLWAVGVVLHEMLTGTRPFGGGHDLSTLYSILHEQPPSLRADVPPHLVAVVGRLLAKSPAERFDSAADVLTHLDQSGRAAPRPARRLGIRSHRTAAFTTVAAVAAVALIVLGVLLTRGPTAPDDAMDDVISVAVLPFTDTSPAGDQEHLGEGVAEEILNALAQVPGLRVPARASSFRFDSGQLSPAEISRRLNVSTVLEGSVHRAGDRIRITARLVDARAGRNVWAHTFERRFSEFYAVQAEIAASAAAALRRSTAAPAGSAQSSNVAAIELHLRGLFHWNRRTSQDLIRATQFFEQAALLDPAWGKPWAGLALTYAVMAPLDRRNAHLLLRVDSIAARALERDPTLAEAHAARGYAAHWLWQWPIAERELSRAIQVNPQYSTAHQWYGEHLVKLGEVERGLAMMQRAIDLDPASLVAQNDLGILLYLAGRLDESIAQLERVRALDPAFPLPNLLLHRVNLVAGNADAAAEAGRRWAESSGLVAASDLIALARATADPALRPAALAVLAAWEGQEVPNWPDIAMYYTLLGENERALSALERAQSTRSPLLNQLGVAPWTLPLRNEPRFLRILREMAFPAAAQPVTGRAFPAP